MHGRGPAACDAGALRFDRLSRMESGCGPDAMNGSALPSVVVVSDFGYIAGGAPQVAIASASGLARRGVPVTFVYALGPPDERIAACGACVRQVAARDVWSVRNPARAAAQGIWNAAAAAGFRGALASADPRETVIHFHQWTKVFSPSAIAVAVRMGFPVALSLHDYFLVCPTGCYYDFQRQVPCALHPMSVACILRHCDSRSYAHKLVRLVRHIGQQAALSRPKAGIAAVHVSDAARALAEPLLPAGLRHYVVGNPLEQRRACRSAAETRTDYVFIGRLTAEKGCLTLARAARIAGVPATFIGAGPCDDEIRRANPAARLLGWLPAGAVENELRQARALVFPSRWRETAGLVCQEALACGVPVLAARRTAAADLIQSGVNGYVFEADDEMGLAQMLRALQDPDIVARMSIAAFERYWAAPPSVDAHVDALLAVYADLLLHRPPERYPGSAALRPSPAGRL